MRRLVLLATGILGGMVPALAQTPPASYSDAIVVSASLAPEREADLSAATSVVDAGEIDRRQLPSALDLLRDLPGVAASQQGSPGKLGSLFVRGANGNQTLVLWNGVKLNDPYFGGFDWAFLATDGVERIELVRGPYSALYGSEAVGGVVQVLTRRGEGGTARLEGGANDYLRASLAGGHRFGNVQLDLAGFARRGAGVLDNDFYDGEELAVAADWQATESFRLGLQARGGDARIGLPYDYFGQPALEREQRLQSRTLALPLSWTATAWEVEAQAARYDTDLELRDPGNPYDASRAQAGRDQARLTVTRHFGDTGWLAGGADWERQQVDTESLFGGLTGVHQSTAAAFAQGMVHWGRARLDLGLRYDDNDAFGSETSAKAGASLALGEHQRLRASYGESFRAPSLTDLYYPGYGNPDLQPERGRSADLALEGGQGGWSWALGVFQTRFTNLIQVDFTTFQPYNTGRARSRGVEATVAVRRERFDARLAVTRLDTEDLATGKPLLRRPEWSGSLVGGFSVATVRLGGALRYVGARTDFGDVPLAGYTVLDLTVDWRALDRLRPYARLENVGDARYEEAAGYPAPGRTWSAGMAWDF